MVRIQGSVYHPNILTSGKNLQNATRTAQRPIATSTPKSIKDLTKNTLMSASPILIAATAIASLALLCVGLFKKTKKAPEATNKEAVKPAVIEKPVVKETVKLEPTKENLKMLETRLIQCLLYEKEINFSNIEILQKLPEEARKKILSYLDMNFDDAKNFLTFAAGGAAGTVLCKDSHYSGVFTPLYGNNIYATDLFWNNGGELVFDRKTVKGIITKNLDFFRRRLNLPDKATVKDVEEALFLCAYNSPIRNNEKYGDVLELIKGNDIYDACHAQIVRDIKRFKPLFFPGYAENLDDYKALLKKYLLNKQSSYYNMPQEFKDEIVRKIDSIPIEAFKERIMEPIEFMRDPKSELAEFRQLETLVEKLERAQKDGSIIKYE